MRSLVLTLATLLFIFSNVYAQKQSPLPTPSPSPSATETPVFVETNPIQIELPAHTNTRTTFENNLGWGVLLFGAVILGFEMLIMLKLKKGWGVQSTRMVGVTLVIVSGLFLIVTGYSQQQIAPMIGLLGTIVGFLLGKTSKDDD